MTHNNTVFSQILKLIPKSKRSEGGKKESKGSESFDSSQVRNFKRL